MKPNQKTIAETAIIPSSSVSENPVAMGFASMLEIIEDDKALDALTDERLKDLEEGSKEERFDKCRNVLNMAQAAGKLGEKVSILAGAVFLEMERDELWKVAKREDGTGYKSFIEFTLEEYGYFKPKRIAQFVDAYRYAKQYRGAYIAAGLPLPKSETDCRVPLAAQRKVEKWAEKEKDVPRQQAIQLGKDAAIETATIATAMRKKELLAKNPDADLSKVDLKPSYKHLVAAQKVVYRNHGMDVDEDDKDEDNGKDDEPNRPAPRKPELVFVDFDKRIHAIEEMNKRIKADTLPLKKDGPDLTDYFISMKAENVKVLRDQCAALLLIADEMLRASMADSRRVVNGSVVEVETVPAQETK